jgi:hypothetical protein
MRGFSIAKNAYVFFGFEGRSMQHLLGVASYTDGYSKIIDFYFCFFYVGAEVVRPRNRVQPKNRMGWRLEWLGF